MDRTRKVEGKRYPAGQSNKFRHHSLPGVPSIPVRYQHPGQTSISQKTSDGSRLDERRLDQSSFGVIRPTTSSGSSLPSYSKETSLNGTFQQKGSKQVNGSDIWDNRPLGNGKKHLTTLNTKLVTMPKTSGEKKSQSFQILHRDNISKVENCAKTPEKQEKILENKPGEKQLVSFSIEEELRLLMEMGWIESDDENYEITEDDIQQFHNRLKQVQQQRNGLVRTLSKKWSPKHIPVYQADMQELKEPVSSVSNDSL